MRASEVDEWVDASGLAPGVRERLRSLTWREGDAARFADARVVCSLLPPAERAAFLATMIRTPALVAQLRVAPGANTTALAAWWTTPDRPDVPTLLASLAAMPEGGTIDVAHLLPPVPRSLLYRFPSPGAPARDCVWTAWNFRGAKADDAWLDPARVRESLERDYTVVAQADARLGDVILFLDGERRFTHAAVYVADDVVYTKNGDAPTTPWALMSFADLWAGYARSPGASVVFYRRR